MYSCASSGPLGGGPIDKDPPIIIAGESTSNMTTNFTDREIILTFDEYVELKNVAKEIVVSPPLTYKLLTRVRGKKIVLSFNEYEILKDSVTYIINMGSAIQDFRAGNKLENYRFVFSTGDYIDSLYIKGKVIDMSTGKPLDKALVMVYDELKDSIVIQKRPMYFTKTDKDGNFILENIKSDTFRIYASTDENANYLFNIGSESIGFVPEDIILDTPLLNIELGLTKPSPSLRIVQITNDYRSTIDVLFNVSLTQRPIYIVDPPVQTWAKTINDTLRIWYESDYDSLSLTFPALDTFTIYKRDKPPTDSLISKLVSPPQFRMGDTLMFEFSAPIKIIEPKDSTWIKGPISNNQIKDSIAIVDTIAQTASLDFLVFSDPYKVGAIPQVDQGLTYDVIVLPGQFIDIYGRNNDTLTHRLNIMSEEDLSEVLLNISGFDSVTTYAIKIYTKSTNLYKETITAVDTLRLQFNRFIPSDITVEVITDTNNNGEWDPANIWGRIPAEKIYIKKIPAPKPNWTVEEEIDISIPQSSIPESKMEGKETGIDILKPSGKSKR